MTEPIVVIAQILRDELMLEDGRVMLGNQQHTIPDEGLYVALAYGQPSTVAGSKNEYDPVYDQEVQSVTMRHTVQVDVMAHNTPSGGNDARARKEEVLMALGSRTAERLCLLNNMHIARNPGPIVDNSALEGAAMLSRYTIEVPIMSTHRKQKDTEIFDSFEVAVNSGDPFDAKENPNG